MSTAKERGCINISVPKETAAKLKSLAWRLKTCEEAHVSNVYGAVIRAGLKAGEEEIKKHLD